APAPHWDRAASARPGPPAPTHPYSTSVLTPSRRLDLSQCCLYRDDERRGSPRRLAASSPELPQAPTPQQLQRLQEAGQLIRQRRAADAAAQLRDLALE